MTAISRRWTAAAFTGSLMVSGMHCHRDGAGELDRSREPKPSSSVDASPTSGADRPRPDRLSQRARAERLPSETLGPTAAPARASPAPAASASSSAPPAALGHKPWTASTTAAPPPMAIADRTDAQGRCVAPSEFGQWSWDRIRQVKDAPDKSIILTIDGGLDINGLGHSLDTLRQLNLTATFFLMTGPMERDPRGIEILRRIVADGHELANHTADHVMLTKKSSSQIAAQLNRADAWVQTSIGRSIGPFLREPYLDRDARVDRETQSLCYRSIWFSIYTRDDSPGITARQITDAVLMDDETPRDIPSGTILMFHASQPANLEAWPDIVGQTRKRGHQWMALGQALKARELTTSVKATE